MKKLLMAAAGATGAGLAIVSGAGPLMVLACGFAAAGAVPVTTLLTKVAAKASGKDVKFDRDDAATVVSMGLGLTALATVAPKEYKEDPSAYAITAFATPAFANFVVSLATAPNDAREAVSTVTNRLNNRY